MPKYRVVLEGQNFPLSLDSSVGLFGFYTTRWVKAGNEKEAGVLAVNLIRADEWLASRVRDDVESDPRIDVESISRVSWWARMKNSGYSFYPMNE